MKAKSELWIAPLRDLESDHESRRSISLSLATLVGSSLIALSIVTVPVAGENDRLGILYAHTRQSERRPILPLSSPRLRFSLLQARKNGNSFVGVPTLKELIAKRHTSRPLQSQTKAFLAPDEASNVILHIIPDVTLFVGISVWPVILGPATTTNTGYEVLYTREVFM